MGLTTFSVYPWDIENTVNHVEEVLHTHLEDVQKAWRQEFVAGLRLIPKSQSYWHM